MASDEVPKRLLGSSDPEAERKLAIDQDYMKYVSGIRENQGAATMLVDNSGIKSYMNHDSSISNMLHRYKPVYQPDRQLIRKPVILPVKPNHVQYSGRNLEGYYLSQRRGPKGAIPGKRPLVTNPIYQRNYSGPGGYINNFKSRIEISPGGHPAPPGLINRPPTKLETAFLRRLPRTLGNNPKYDRASRVYVARDPAPRLRFEGSRQLAPIKSMINKADSVTNNPSVRKFVNNPFVRQKNLAMNFGWANRIRKYARNVAPPESVISKKTEYVNVGTRPALVNRRIRNLAATRVEHFDEIKHKPVQNPIQVYGGRLVGKSRVGGQAARSIPIVQKESIITHQPHVVSRALPNILDRHGLIETRELVNRPIYEAPVRLSHKKEQNTLPNRGSIVAKLRNTTLPGRRNVNPSVGNRLTY